MYSARQPIRTVSPDCRHMHWSTNKPHREAFCVRPETSSSHSNNLTAGASTSRTRPKTLAAQASLSSAEFSCHTTSGDLDIPGQEREREPSDRGTPVLGNDNDGSTPSEDANNQDKSRRVIDFDIEDSEWEDEPEGKLPGLGTTTHRSCNPGLVSNPLRKQQRKASGPNTCVTAAKWKEGAKCLEALAEDLDVWEAECEQRVQELADKHGMKVKEVQQRILRLSTYGVRCRVSLYNAKISRIMGRLNAGRSVGDRYTMPEVKRMAMEDPSMLEGFMEAEKRKREMIAQIIAKHKAKARGTHMNNLSAATDAKRTMDRLMVEITNLVEQVGMIGFAMFSRGHVHDQTLPVTIESWGAMEFFREVLKKDPADVATLFELWAVSQEHGKTKKNKLLKMQQEGTSIVKSGLYAILGVTKCAMNYDNYIPKLVQGKGVGLVNWPEGVEFKRMSLQSVVGPMQILLDSLKSGVTRWKVLTMAEKKKLTDQYNEMVERGEVKEKEKPKKTKTRKAQKAAIVEDNDEEEDEEDREDSGEEDKEEEEERRTGKKSKGTAKSKPAPPTAKSKPAAKSKSAAKAKPPTNAKAKPTRKLAAREEDDNDTPPRKAPKSKPPCKARRDDDEEEEEDDEDDDEPPARKSKPAAKPKPLRKSTHEDKDNEEEDDGPPPTQVKASRKVQAPARGQRGGRRRAPHPQVKAEAEGRWRRARGGGGGGEKENSRKRKRAEREDDDEEEEVLVAKKKSRDDGGGGKRKRTEEECDEEDGGKRKKKKVIPPGHNNALRTVPRPRPLYGGKKTTTAAAALTDDHVALPPASPSASPGTSPPVSHATSPRSSPPASSRAPSPPVLHAALPRPSPPASPCVAPHRPHRVTPRLLATPHPSPPRAKLFHGRVYRKRRKTEYSAEAR
ncbi:hypothetical protein C8R45DRAFT_943718 [Mycena sanguinolenta]|nr:hypothetical protein C8R45DRAFT_943718 [Mycena sanguinolenta]